MDFCAAQDCNGFLACRTNALKRSCVAFAFTKFPFCLMTKPLFFVYISLLVVGYTAVARTDFVEKYIDYFILLYDYL